jgi:glycosyltransferase involved in cell wall biosynthesis
MKPKVLISVIMPCYNCERYVGAAIESILTQSFQDFELIIINDGSTDNSHDEIIKRRNDRIRYIPLEKNVGNYPARNAGIMQAKGKYISVMDADDIAYKERLEIQYNYLEQHPKVGAIGGQGQFMNASGELSGKMTNPVVPYKQLRTFLLMNNFIAHPTLMVRSSFLHRYNLFYNENYRYASDFEFISRCSALFPVMNIDQELIKYRLHQEQISSKHFAMQVQYADLIRLNQLKSNNFQITAGEEEIYLRLMKKVKLNSSDDLVMGMSLLNNLLYQNRKLKVYNNKFLFGVFDYVLHIAQEKL